MEKLLKKIRELKNIEMKETLEDIKTDIAINALKIILTKKSKYIEDVFINFHKVISDMNYYIIPSLIWKKFSYSEYGAKFVYEHSEELGLTKDIETFENTGKYEIREAMLYDVVNEKYTNESHKILIKEFKNNKVVDKFKEYTNKRATLLLFEFNNEIEEFINSEDGTLEKQNKLLIDVFNYFDNISRNDKEFFTKDEETIYLKAMYKTRHFLEKEYRAFSKEYLESIIKNKDIDDD
jgi:hypothetical protein